MNRCWIAVLVALTIGILLFLIGQVNFIDRTTTLNGQSHSRRKDADVTIHPATTDQPTTTATPLLRDIHIVMIGDSLMRYQYLSLAYRLRFGVWFDQSLSYYNLVDELTFEDAYHNNTWGAFLLHTNRLLYPYEVCDCRRQALHENWKPSLLENRYYYDPNLNNSVVYLFAKGHEYPLQGRLRAPTETHRKQPLSAFLDYDTIAWNYPDWADVIRHHVVDLDPPPRHIVMNAAFWPHRFGWDPTSPRKNSSEHYSNDTKNLLHVIQEYPQFHFVWKTTTYSLYRVNSGKVVDDIMCAHFPACINMSFTRGIQRRFYRDRVHFREPVYRATNEVMLGQFGYLPPDYRPMNLSDILNQR